jgi:hypothetical protein
VRKIEGFDDDDALTLLRRRSLSLSSSLYSDAYFGGRKGGGREGITHAHRSLCS